MNKLIIENLNKTYSNGVKALDDVSLELDSGMFGLLGPNGAGKSTLMRTIATLQEADSGTLMLNEIDIHKQPEKLRQVLGYLPQEFGVYPNISAQALLDHVAVLKGIVSKNERKEMVEYLLQKVNLFDKRKKAVKSFSGGMKQRVGIAQALIGNPKLIIVDEPTAGLDPGERNRFHNLLADVGEEVVVILSTHIVDDVRELCNQMAIMNLGQLVYTGSPLTVIEELKGRVWRKSVERGSLKEYMVNYQVISNKMVAGKPQLHVLSETDPGDGFAPVEPNLEDVFFTKINANEPVEA